MTNYAEYMIAVIRLNVYNTKHGKIRKDGYLGEAGTKLKFINGRDCREVQYIYF